MAIGASLAFNPNDDQPYVAFADGTIGGGKASVMKYNGMNWTYVGNSGFSAGWTYFVNLAFNTSGQPFVAYQDYQVSASVMKFDGTNWVNVGNADFSAGHADYISLALSPTGQPCVAYEDYENEYRATVMEFDGTNWVNVGNAGFSTGEVWFTSLAFNPSGQPYVAYTDFSNSQKATVKYYNAPAGVHELAPLQVSIYPNPATDKIAIEISGNPKQSSLSIVNIEGQQLLTRQITEPQTQIDISNLPSGVYFVRVISERTVEVGKIIKE